MFIDLAILILLVLLVYAWVGYPLVLRGLVSRPAARSAGSDIPSARERPSVAVLLSAHNEETHIAARLGNLLDLDYPQELVTVHVGVDGCTDGTLRIASERAAGCPRVHVTEGRERGGKIAMLKRLVSQARADILVLTDANTLFARDALTRLVRRFEDARVGGVCGRLVFTDVSEAAASGASGEGPPEGLYWEWETRLKEWESLLDSCLGANGAIYALRRELFWTEIPDNTVVDDFVLGMKVREHDLRVKYEPLAQAREEFPDSRDEWHRRVRIGAGDYQALGLCAKCLLPRYGKFAWMFASHKVLRWLTPHVLLAVLLLSLWRVILGSAPAGLNRAVMPILVLLGVGILGVCAIAGRAADGDDKVSCVLRACNHLVTMQAALFVGFLRFCRGGLRGDWARTPRRKNG